MKKILVTPDNFVRSIGALKKATYLGFDTETYGVDFEDRLFSLQIASSEASYYFNCHDYGDGTFAWHTRQLCHDLHWLFHDPDKVWFIHNAKFDMHRLANEGTHLKGRVHCTQAIERILYNQHVKYGLDACLKRRGRSKNDRVGAYIKQEKCFTQLVVEGKKRKIKKMHFEQVPFNIMFEYGCDDAQDVLFLGRDQLDNIYNWDLYNTETELTKTCFTMERIGIKVDRNYVQQAKEFETAKLQECIEQASLLGGEKFRNGPKWLRAAFDRCGQPYKLNPKTNNPIFDKHALAGMESPIAGLVKEIRTREKYIGTYYTSFDYFADSYDILHATINQAGTDTGRFSYRDPNLQNVPKEEDFPEGSVQVRKCFIPREDHCFVMIDFDQQEFRLMLDYAGEHELIRRIMDEGVDVHQATADMMGVSRKEAKTLNFGLLYGMGVAKLAKQLDITDCDAKNLRDLYFSRLPNVQRLIRDVQNTAKSRGYIQTWAGRRLHFDKVVIDPDTGERIELYYKAPNHLIQGGCGDIARVAMNRLQKLTQPWDECNMLVQVHDEILFEVHKDHLDIVDSLKTVMENVYKPINGMKLTCGVEHSWTSWGKQDVVDGYPRIQV